MSDTYPCILERLRCCPGQFQCSGADVDEVKLSWRRIRKYEPRARMSLTKYKTALIPVMDLGGQDCRFLLNQ